MCSDATRKETEEFFREQKWFGLREEDVVFFNQGG
jgi:UDP-N-acetylglucosamine pyrophosphorylase